MARVQVGRDLVFLGSDLRRPRMEVEREKLADRFPAFEFVRHGDRVSAVRGPLATSYGGRYVVSVAIPERYPYEMPAVFLPEHEIDPAVHHRYREGDLCLMKPEQWSRNLSLAYLVARAAVWLNKYDAWQRQGKQRWPGNEQ